jgi:hypothetical protein
MALLFHLLGECGKLIAVLLISAAVIDSPCHFANSNAVVPKGPTSGGSESRQGPATLARYVKVVREIERSL